MPLSDAINPELYATVLLPLLIFLARVCDVTIGTLRIVFVARGHKYLAPLLGFFEVLIWIIAIGEIMKHLDSWICYAAYAAGFAAGNFVGLKVEERLALGNVIVRAMTTMDAEDLIASLKKRRFGVTTYVADGLTGKTKVIFTVVPRKELPAVIEAIHAHNPKAFYTVEDVRTLQAGVFPKRETSATRAIGMGRRKGK